jgi:hypothetical protein
MNRPNDTSITQRSENPFLSRHQRARLFSSIMKDKRFMYLEQIAMVLLAISLWLAAS